MAAIEALLAKQEITRGDLSVLPRPMTGWTSPWHSTSSIRAARRLCRASGDGLTADYSRAEPELPGDAGQFLRW